MATLKAPRIWVSNASPKAGDVLRVRAQMEHVMESGLRTDPATGKVRPRNILSHFEARLDDALLFAWTPGISIAQNPYIEFTFMARKSGTLHFHWKDEAGQTLKAEKAIAVA